MLRTRNHRRLSMDQSIKKDLIISICVLLIIGMFTICAVLTLSWNDRNLFQNHTRQLLWKSNTLEDAKKEWEKMKSAHTILDGTFRKFGKFGKFWKRLSKHRKFSVKAFNDSRYLFYFDSNQEMTEKSLKGGFDLASVTDVDVRDSGDIFVTAKRPVQRKWHLEFSEEQKQEFVELLQNITDTYEIKNPRDPLFQPMIRNTNGICFALSAIYVMRSNDEITNFMRNSLKTAARKLRLENPTNASQSLSQSLDNFAEFLSQLFDEKTKAPINPQQFCIKITRLNENYQHYQRFKSRDDGSFKQYVASKNNYIRGGGLAMYTIVEISEFIELLYKFAYPSEPTQFENEVPFRFHGVIGLNKNEPIYLSGGNKERNVLILGTVFKGGMFESRTKVKINEFPPSTKAFSVHIDGDDDFSHSLAVVKRRNRWIINDDLFQYALSNSITNANEAKEAAIQYLKNQKYKDKKKLRFGIGIFLSVVE